MISFDLIHKQKLPSSTYCFMEKDGNLYCGGNDGNIYILIDKGDNIK